MVTLNQTKKIINVNIREPEYWLPGITMGQVEPGIQ